MDALKNMAGKLGGSGENKQQNQGGQGGQGEDYLDKAFDSAQKKFGMEGKLNREQSEKVTDTMREQFEKATGKDIPDKYSN